MHIRFGIALLLLVLAPSGAHAATELDIDDAPIETVRVFVDRAQVDRSTKVPVGSGRTEVVLDGLPAPLLPGSVRAWTGDERAEVIGLTQREEVHQQERRVEVRELMVRVRELQEQIRTRLVDDATLQSRLDQIGQLREYTRTVLASQQTQPNLDLDSFDDSLDLFRSDASDILDRRSVLQAELTALHRDLTALQGRIGDLQYGAERITTSVTVTLEATSSTTTELVVSYGVGGVTWQPRYDLVYEDEELTLHYLAEISQSSGEDWEGVELVFTTARPDEMVPPPGNQPLHLSGYKEKETTVQLGSTREEAKEEDAPAPPADPAPSVGITRRTLSVDLTVPRPATVPADGRPYRMAVLETALDATVDNYAAPGLSPHVYLRARTSNQTGIQLLAGRADVFRDSGYVGSIWLADLAPGERLPLSLGPAGPVMAKREFDVMRNRQVERTAGRKKVHFVHDVVINNYGELATEVVVAEAVPLSRVAQVKVELAEETTEGFEVGEDESIHTWTLSLAAGEEKRVHLSYVVDLPEDYYWEGF